MSNSSSKRIQRAVCTAAILAAATAAAVAANHVAETRRQMLPLEQVRLWRSPSVDVPRLRAEDEANREVPGVPRRIGFPMSTDLSPANSGTWEDLGDGNRVWRLRVKTEGALWTVLGFDVFRLQPGGELRVHDPGRETEMGPFTSADIRRHGQLWFPPIAGDELVVELLWPDHPADELPDVHLGTVSHGYKAFGVIGRDQDPADGGPAPQGVDDSGSCNIDVACPLGDNWQDQIRGAVILLSGGSGFCSGSLINTTADDCRPYLLTAAHCGAGPSTTIGFNFEKPQCGSGTPPPATNQTLSGATVLADFASSDFTLLEMDNAPPEQYGVYFNGWSRDTQPSSEAWGIHHPSGDVKKISHNADPLVDGTNYGPNHWRITEWEEGTTEGGSSGSPLFDTNKRIVGQLHGGLASCTNITWDEYGKIAASWTGGGTGSTRLQDWLDPAGTGAVVMDGVDAATCAVQLAGEVRLTRNLYSCTDVLDITLRDDHLTGEATHDVTVYSDTESTPETVTLTATDTQTGRFAGSITLGASSPVPGDGVLSTAHDDTITVEYLDADDGIGGGDIVTQAVAQADCQSPVIVNVQSGEVSGSSARITWDTDEPADSVVTHGLTPGSGTSVTDGTLVTDHSVRLLGLAECTWHYFEVASTDPVGNGTSDDNTGAWYSFETTRDVRPEFVSADTPLAIPDNDPLGVSSSILVADDKIVLDVDVQVDITHTYTGDLTLRLVTPAAQTIALSNRRGGGGNDYSATVFDDAAATAIGDGTPPFGGSFRPDQPLAAANGINAAGEWRLEVVDGAGFDTGTIDSWTLMLTFPGEACGPHLAYDTHTLQADSCGSGGPGDADGLWDAGEQVRFGLRLHNDGDQALTGVTARVGPLAPGITMIDDSAAFADIPRGEFGDSVDPHFSALLGPDLSCTETLRFEVEVTSDQGTWTSELVQSLGLVFPGGGVALSEGFEAGIPADWTVVDGFADGQSWFADDASDPSGCANDDPLPPVTGTWAAVDSDCTGSGVDMDEELVTPILDLSAAWTATLEFDHFFDRYQSELADVDVRSSLTGGSWINVARYAADTANAQHDTLDVTPYAAGAADAQIRFRYHDAAWEWYWYVDNVVVRYTAAGDCEMNPCASNPAAPLPVPSLFADRSDPSGSSIVVSWDDQCAPTAAKIVYGPLDQVSTLAVSGAACAIANPHAWDTVPPDSVWFVVVGEDGTGTESSWGLATSGERSGLTASGTCGSLAKDISGICP